MDSREIRFLGVHLPKAIAKQDEAAIEKYARSIENFITEIEKVGDQIEMDLQQSNGNQVGTSTSQPALED